jgi:hypothetical protein
MIDKVVSLAMSIASRGIDNKKIDLETKQLRAISCFGYKDIPKCEFLINSKLVEGMNYCGKCGCGDFPHTWLVKSAERYSKLDYPKLNCPLSMPGFSNYDPGIKNPRKEQIEKLDPEEIKFVEVTINGIPNT